MVDSGVYACQFVLVVKLAAVLNASAGSTGPRCCGLNGSRCCRRSMPYVPSNPNRLKASSEKAYTGQVCSRAGSTPERRYRICSARPSTAGSGCRVPSNTRNMYAPRGRVRASTTREKSAICIHPMAVMSEPFRQEQQIDHAAVQCIRHAGDGSAACAALATVAACAPCEMQAAATRMVASGRVGRWRQRWKSDIAGPMSGEMARKASVFCGTEVPSLACRRSTAIFAHQRRSTQVMKAIAMASVTALMACAGASKQAKPQSSTAPQSAEAKAAEEQDKKDEAKLGCVWERPPGSNIAEKICRYPEQSEQERDATERTIYSLPPVVQTNKG